MEIKRTINNKRDYGQFFAICKRNGFDYKDKVAEYTANFTDTPHDSLRRLTDEQFLGMMIIILEITKGQRKDFTPKPGDKQRKMLIGMAKSMFWGDNTRETVTMLDNWIRKQKFKKPLMRHTPNELNLIIAIFEQKVSPHYMTGLNK